MSLVISIFYVIFHGYSLYVCPNLQVIIVRATIYIYINCYLDHWKNYYRNVWYIWINVDEWKCV